MSFFLNWPLILSISHFIYLLPTSPPSPLGHSSPLLKKKKSTMHLFHDLLSLRHWQFLPDITHKSLYLRLCLYRPALKSYFHSSEIFFILHKDTFTKKCHSFFSLRNIKVITDRLPCQLIRSIVDMACYDFMIFQIFTYIDCLNADSFHLYFKSLSLKSQKCGCTFLLIFHKGSLQVFSLWNFSLTSLNINSVTLNTELLYYAFTLS